VIVNKQDKQEKQPVTDYGLRMSQRVVTNAGPGTIRDLEFVGTALKRVLVSMDNGPVSTRWFPAKEVAVLKSAGKK
jgi:hypothetical protein